MAPWPEQGTDPKAPERTKTSDNRTVDTLKSRSEPPEDKKSCTVPVKDDGQGEAKKKDVHSLDDGQLKALLDEAIQYKCPKDREGKSKIFRELLQKVEADENVCGYPVVGLRGSSRRALRTTGRSVTVSERATRGGSLQNIFVAAGEFDGHHTGGARRKNKQRPGSSVSARQREGGSLPCNVNAGWPAETWQTEQVRRKGLFDKEPASCCTATQARRQTLMHSTSNELPAGAVHSAGELYPLRRHHSTSDQSRTSVAEVKHKSHSESSAARRMPQVTKPEYTSLDMGGLDLEMKTFSRVHCPPSDRYRLTASDVESESEQGSGEVYTTRASLEVEPVDQTFELDLHHVESKPLVNMKLGDSDCVQLNDNYTSVQSVVSDQSDARDIHRHHTVYKAMNAVSTISLVNISAKSDPGGCRTVTALPQLQIQATDENGNPSQQVTAGSRGAVTGSAAASTKKNHHKRKQLSEKNVVLSVSQNIAGYRGDKDLETVLSFIESDKNKSGKPSLKKTGGGGVLVGSLSTSKSSKKQHKTMAKSMTKCSSLEEISQRNLSDLTESAESERSVVLRKPRSNEDTSRERRSWGEQVYIRSESQNDISVELEAADNSDSEFQMVTKKQRKRKSGGESGGKRGRNPRPSRRSPRRKSTSSVPPSERSGDSDVDSVHSLPVGGQPVVMSYAHIAAGVPMDRNDDIEEWCNSVTQHLAPLRDDSEPDKCDTNNRKSVSSVEECGNKVVDVAVIDRRKPAAEAANLNAVAAAAGGGSARKHWTVAQVDRKRNNLNHEEFPSLPTKNGGWLREEKPTPGKGGREARSKSAGRSAPGSCTGPAVAVNHRPAVILLQDELGASARDSSVCEITFGFEVNQQLLTSDDSAQAAEEDDLTGLDADTPDAEETCSTSSSSYSSDMNGQKTVQRCRTGREGRDGTDAEITNATVQELFKRHETMSRPRPRGPRHDIADIADAYVPPKAPVLFNHDKIVNFVGLAWEDIMRQGKIQYYTAEN